jgi:hypothetical protein
MVGSFFSTLRGICKKMKAGDRVVLQWGGFGTILQVFDSGFKFWVKPDNGGMSKKFWTDYDNLRPIEETNLSGGTFGPIEKQTND